jgi:hypothetical protein
MRKTPKRQNVTTNLLRRRLLQGGAGLVALPLLDGCGPASEDAMLPATPAPSPVPGPVPVPVPVTKSAARGIHVSYPESVGSGRTITWFTDGLADPGSVVEWGPVAANMTAAEIASLPMPLRTEGTATPAYGIEVLTHRVDLTDLPAGSAIRYRVGDGTSFGPVHVLQALPEAGGFCFIHFGDVSASEAAQANFRCTREQAPDFFIVAGDLAYANGEQAIWDTWFDAAEVAAAAIPMITCPGNHEAKDGGGAGYTSRVSTPGAETYYSFDVQRVHFCCSTAGCLLTEENPASVAALAEELVWMETDLAAAAARRAAGEIDFIVFVQHYTIWTNEDGRDPANPSLVAVEEDMLLRYGVDLLLVGHDHIYERSKPMAYGLPVPTGYIQVTQGGGGQSLYEILANPASWSATLQLRHGYSLYTVTDGLIEVESWAVSDDQGVLLPAPEKIDAFSVPRRLPALAATHALPARSRSLLLNQFDAVVADTLRRNAAHDAAEHLAPLR